MAEKIVERTATSMYIEDLAKYSIVVNRRRSIPAIQDGLIPVQRRILYGAYKKGMRKPSEKRKSAQLVGLVMGEYHPHGDCLSASTLVYCFDDGKFYTIKELAESNVKSITILAVNQYTGNIVQAKATNFREAKIDDTEYNIIFSNGHVVKCTGNHPFMLPNGEWIKAENLEPNTEIYQVNIKDNKIYNRETDKIFIKDIKIVKTEPKIYYDFTVEKYENMLLPIITEDSINDSVISMICVHNSAIYGTIVNMAAWYKIKYPLMYAYGNWGAVSGSGPASQRYTETSMSDFGYEVMIDELAQSNNVVDWIDTFTREDKEPECLPSKLPIILINGSFGIGLGMQISLPSHNLGEVVDATIDLIKHPNKKVILIPDLTQECELIGTDKDWKDISYTGSGSFKARGKIETVTDKKGNVTLYIKSLPDGVSCNTVYSKINDLVAAKQLPMVKHVINSLENEKPNIIIYLKQGADPGYVKQFLYAKTPVQSSFHVNFEAVDNNSIDISRFSYTSYLLKFIDQRYNIKFRLYCNKLQQVMTRYIQVEAFVKVMTSKEFDKIIDMIRKYSGTDTDYIIEYMIKHCKLSDIQAKFILSRTLPQLSKGHLDRYMKEIKELKAKNDLYMKYVTDDGTMIREDIIAELKDLKKKYNTPRMCTPIGSANSVDIPKGTFKIVITERNYIRKIPDIDKVGIVRRDNPKFILRVDNSENLLIFDNKGKVFHLPIHKIPITDRSGPGTDIRILIKNLTSDICAVFYEPIFKKISESSNKHYLTILTRSNTIKKLDIEDFLNVSPSGLMYSKIKPEDEVVGVALVPHNLDIAICSDKKVLRCKLSDIPVYKRNATGVKAMNTSEPIHGLSVFYPDATDIVVVTKNGKFNRFNIAMLECNSRAKGGNKVIKLDANDQILNVYGVNTTDKIRVLTSDGAEEVLVSDIKVKSSIAAGTKMIKSKGIIVRADVIR